MVDLLSLADCTVESHNTNHTDFYYHSPSCFSLLILPFVDSLSAEKPQCYTFTKGVKSDINKISTTWIYPPFDVFIGADSDMAEA